MCQEICREYQTDIFRTYVGGCVQPKRPMLGAPLISKLFLSWSYCCIVYFVYFTLAYIFLLLTISYTFYQLLQSIYTLLCTFLDRLISVFLYSNPKLSFLLSN